MLTRAVSTKDKLIRAALAVTARDGLAAATTAALAAEAGVAEGTLYRHYKGNEYTVIGIARHSETLEAMVIYRQEYGDGSLWVRPLAMFQEMVMVERKEVPRFQFLRRDEE